MTSACAKLLLEDNAVGVAAKVCDKSKAPALAPVCSSNSSGIASQRDLMALLDAVPRPAVLAYEVTAVLSTSLFGHVARAKHRATGAEVAVKISSIERIQSALRQKRTAENPLTETLLLRSFSGAATQSGATFVLQLLDEFVYDNCHWAVLELCDKGDLFSMVERLPSVPEAVAKNIFQQILAGVAFMHASGVAHLDLKPENILLTSKDRVKICDFGMARRVAHIKFAKEQKDPQQGRVLRGAFGTIMYMAPEVFANRVFDPFLADVYSAGVILYLLLTGTHAYEKPTLDDPRFATIWAGKHGIEHLLNALNILPGLDISNEAVDLLARILCSDDSRWSVEQILAHPWMRSESLSPSGNSVPAVTATERKPAKASSGVAPMDLSPDVESVSENFGTQSVAFSDSVVTLISVL